MELPEFEFVQPQSLEEACSILGAHQGKAVPLAGGTALSVALRYRLRKPAVVIGLKRLTSLDYVSGNGKSGLKIGSMATLKSLEKSPLLLKDYGPLAQAIELIAIPPIRNKATLGGNLCLDNRCIYYDQSEFWRSGQKTCFRWGGTVCHAVEKGRRCQAVYQGDLASVLIAIGAEVKIASSKGERTILLGEFYTGRGEKGNVLKPDELLIEIRIPTPAEGTAFAYEKLRVREGMEFPMAGAAVMVKKSRSGIIEKAKIVLGAVGPSPTEVPKAAGLLEGNKPTDELIQRASGEAMDGAAPVGNLAINAPYRKKMVGALVNRALRKALRIDDC